jgi:hypothetical protein
MAGFAGSEEKGDDAHTETKLAAPLGSRTVEKPFNPYIPGYYRRSVP